MTHGFHVLKHIHKRKTSHLEPYPHKNKFYAVIDNITIIMAIVVPLTTIPQILQIWINKSAGDVSLFTWCAFLVSAITWLFYSIIHKDKPLIINSILWIILESIVIVLIILYG